MTEVRLNTNLTVETVQQANLQSVLNTLDTQAPLSPLLNKASNLTVSSAPVNLEALMAKLNVETTDTKETTAKTALSSAFETVIARALESGNVSAKNMEILNEANGMSKQLDALNEQIPQLEKEVKQLERDVNQKERAVTDAQNKVDQLVKKYADLTQQKEQAVKTVDARQAEVDMLNNQIAEETDPVVKAKLEKQLTEAETKLAKAQNELTVIQQKVTDTQQSLDTAKTNLTTAQNDLASAKTALNDKKVELQTAKEQKATLEKQIKDKMGEISDANVVRQLSEALKMDAADVQNLTEDNSAERSEEQEKYLDKHSPLRIIQNAIANHEQDMLDTIASKKEEKI